MPGSMMSNGISNQLLANICIGSNYFVLMIRVALVNWSSQSTESKIITLNFQNGAQVSPLHWPGSGHLNSGEGGMV